MTVVSLFILCAFSAEGARVAEHAQNFAGWGRTCESLAARFTQQGTHLREVEGAKAVIGSISMMRTLRRANARECTWIKNGDVDVSALSELAGSYLQHSPCYEQSRSALQSAQNLPEEQRDAAVLDGLALLFSNKDDCLPDNTAPADLGDESDEALEEEMDDTTDQLMELAVSNPDDSLIQQESGQLPCVGLADCALLLAIIPWAGAIWDGATAENILLIVGMIVVSIITALFCAAVVHTLVRMFRWLRCTISGSSCEEYAPATWLKMIVGGGCSIVGLAQGPWSLFFVSGQLR